MDCSIQAALSYAIISWVCLNSWPLSQWCYPTISSSATPFSLFLQSFPASESFPMSQLLGGHLASVLPKNIHGWFPLGLTSLISLQLKVFSKVFSSTTILKHQFFGAQLSLWSNSHILTWPLEKITWAPKSLQMVTAAMKLSLLLFGRKDMTNLDSVLKSRDVTFPTKICLIKTMISPLVMNRCGEGKGNSLRYSSLENPRDRGGWWAAVYGVAQSRTWPKWLSSSMYRCELFLFSHSTVSNSLWPHEQQHTRFLCPSLSPGFAQTHVHWVGDAIKPSHSLSPPSPAFNLSEHQGLF